jgi:hypothetical protein
VTGGDKSGTGDKQKGKSKKAKGKSERQGKHELYFVDMPSKLFLYFIDKERNLETSSWQFQIGDFRFQKHSKT